MRALKFRAWDIESEEYRNSSDVLLKNDGSAISRFALGSLDVDLPVNVILEQYTGLKDKNGKEIYEGDIVKMPEWQVEPRYEVVKYNKAGFDPFQEGCFECMSPDGDDVEVIGNVHENPELLKG